VVSVRYARMVRWSGGQRGKLFNVPCAGDRAYDTCVRYAKAPGMRKLFNVQRIIVILKDLTTILRIMQVVRRLTTFLQLCVVNIELYRVRRLPGAL
jgi:hypothetical protein